MEETKKHSLNSKTSWKKHRDGNIFMIEYVVYWGKMEDSKRNIPWIRKLHGYMAKYVSKSPRATYFNYKDLDLGVDI